MDRVKREDVERMIGRAPKTLPERASPQDHRDRALAIQTLLLLEIRDLLADSVMKLEHPMMQVKSGPQEHREFRDRQRVQMGLSSHCFDHVHAGCLIPHSCKCRCHYSELRIFGFDDLKSMGFSEAAIEKLREEAIESAKKPPRLPVPPTRITWLSTEDGKAEFVCAACRRLVKVTEDSMRGLSGPWITLGCNRCRHKHELDGRELEGDIGKMMRAFYPLESDS